MPSVFHTVTNGVTRWDADDVNQFVNDLSGVAGEGKVHTHTTVNSTGWASTERNLDSTNGQIWRAQRYDDVEIAAALKTGFRFSPDGVATGIVPVGRTGDETIAGLKTIQSPLWAVSGNVASGASVALPSTSRIVPITGTTTITAFTGLVAGGWWRLQFASAGCIVRAGAAVRIDGDYVSRQYGTLDIYSPDGTNVYETARSGRNVGCRLRRTNGQAIADSSLGSDTAISWENDSWNFGAIWDVGTPTRIIPGIGFWLIAGAIYFDDWGAHDARARVYQNGSHVRQLFHVRQDTAGSPGAGGIPFATIVENTAAADYLEITISTDAARDIKAGTQYTHVVVARAA